MPKFKSSLRRLKGWTDFKDVFVAVVAAIYLFGYLAWAYYGYRNHLGLIPALRSQYLIAGVVPAAIFGFGVLLVFGLFRLSRWASAHPTPLRDKLGFFLFATGFAAMVLSGFAAHFNLFNQANEIVMPVSAYVTMFGALIQGSKGPGLFRIPAIGLAWVFAALIPVFLLIAYLDDGFERLDSSFGGPAPRCVTLDVDSRELSTETLSFLFTTPPAATSPIAHTQPVLLLFRSGGLSAFRNRDEPRHGRVFAINTSTIHGETTCSEASSQ